MSARPTGAVGVVASLAAAVALAGCGTKESQSAQVRSVIEQYYAAFEKGEGARACSLYTAAAKAEIARDLRESGGPESCEQLVAGKSATLSRHLKRTNIGSVSLTGNKATVILIRPHAVYPERALLVKTPAGWRISEPLVQVLVIR
jgi:hypothetical protein